MAKDRSPQLGWITEPTSMKAGPDIELWRVPKKGVLIGTIISHELIGRGIHYYLGRSGPCTGEDCIACRAGRVPREYFWVAALHRTTDQLFILELTDRAAAPLARAWHQYRTLRGLLFEVGRTTKKDNGPQRLKLLGKAPDDAALMTAPPLIPILNRIWQTAADPWHHPTLEQLSKERSVLPLPTKDAINHAMGQQPTNGNERAGRLGTPDDLRVIAPKDRGIRQGTTEGASHTSTSNPAQQNAHRRHSLESNGTFVAPLLGESDQAS